MKNIQIYNPGKVVFGPGSFDQFIADFPKLPFKKLYLITISPVAALIQTRLTTLEKAGISILTNTSVIDEPGFQDFERLLQEAENFGADSVAGIGGGSVMDTAKLVAAKLHNQHTIGDILLNGFSKKRTPYLACIPTTSGTGSEVSPNAIFINAEGTKVGVISPELVPDAAYVDPALTLGVPPLVTAATGIDALAHCIEAYTNKFAHPMMDLLALEGVRLIGRFLHKAYLNGNDLEARTQIALGSMYGGVCLGPVNTAAVHALAYPLSKEFHIPHGLSIALLLPYVMEFNIPSSTDRYADIAIALGAEDRGDKEDIARAGIELIKTLLRSCGLPSGLGELNIPFEAVETMAASAVQIQRLLKNNPREINADDAERIYSEAFNRVKS
ncbi:Long-chain-alcohol dehydrogenase 1 [Dyadobacter sp. CECT 9275]|uniref:Long-chain-alcohol dehydrogenase 1 n=1 Tax=Dyadobacter helix TaxID=2822344 RepID=A0A916N8K9_9BACT|nr:iron-containing alcohol dehydrogenase [Dyadobacter sp. CECT 9275]CAG5016970.1 Long-chain-alcohol dehydrogenase 1 [Dyadobacter sp. CECT 9275]